MYLTESTGLNDFTGNYSEKFKKEVFFCSNLQSFVYFIPIKIPFIPCYISNFERCPDNFTSLNGFYPNCLQICESLLSNSYKILTFIHFSVPYERLVNSSLEILSNESSSYQVNLNLKNIDFRRYNRPGGIINWYISANSASSKLVKSESIFFQEFDSETKPNKISINEIIINAISQEKNASVINSENFLVTINKF